MAESPAHRFGQLIGELLEDVVRPQLEEFCKGQGLYLDHQKRERPVRSGKKVSWTDQYGNTHDLDFVIERDGTDYQMGRPVAFIETAWRRYTDSHRIYEGSGEFRKYEIHVEYSNGDKVEAFLEAKEKVREFLNFVSRQ